MDDAKKVWTASIESRFVGENAIVTKPYKGMPPHGLILDLMEKDVKIDGHKGALVIKKNYGGSFPKDMPLAGRVAKGAPTGCIPCHRAAPGGDFVFNHDRYK